MKDRDERLLVRLTAETLALFTPGLGHAKVLWQRVREGHEAPLAVEIERLRDLNARLAAANEQLSSTVVGQNRIIEKLLEENARFCK